jgi:hypothetical protein
MSRAPRSTHRTQDTSTNTTPPPPPPKQTSTGGDHAWLLCLCYMYILYIYIRTSVDCSLVYHTLCCEDVHCRCGHYRSSHRRGCCLHRKSDSSGKAKLSLNCLQMLSVSWHVASASPNAEGSDSTLVQSLTCHAMPCLLNPSRRRRGLIQVGAYGMPC